MKPYRNFTVRLEDEGMPFESLYVADSADSHMRIRIRTEESLNRLIAQLTDYKGKLQK